MDNFLCGAVIPIKTLTFAKTRLSPVCSQSQRQDLCLEMLGTMLLAFANAQVAQVMVVSPDEAVGTYLAHCHPHVTFWRHPGNLNQVAQAAGARLAQEGMDTMLFALGDLPLLTAQAVDQALSLAPKNPVVLLPDRHGTGTNAICLSPPNAFDHFAFGPGSFQAHQAIAQAQHLPWLVHQSPSFAWDVDTPGDLLPLETSAFPSYGFKIG